MISYSSEPICIDLIHSHQVTFQLVKALKHKALWSLNDNKVSRTVTNPLEVYQKTVAV